MGLVRERQWLQRNTERIALWPVRLMRDSRFSSHRCGFAQNRGPRGIALQKDGERENGPRYSRSGAQRYAETARDRTCEISARDSRALRLGIYVLLQG